MKLKYNPKPKTRIVPPPQTEVNVHIPDQKEPKGIWQSISDIEQGIRDRAEMLFENVISDIKHEWVLLKREIMDSVDERIEEYTANALKGDQGNEPNDERLRDLIKPLIPEPVKGDSYVLTDKDKEEIADSITVPIVEKVVEKREIIREKPVVIDKTKEVEGLLAEAIEEFKDEIKKLKEKHTTEMATLRSKVMQGSGGGGMGTIKYFKFTCDDLATTFTLPDIPTQEGNAVFPRYQGQSLYPTDHFSVSGRTLTTTFTGESGSFIDGFILT